jgi:hypothetical protein
MTADELRPSRWPNPAHLAVNCIGIAEIVSDLEDP